MKIRYGFVSNSSSSSFVCAVCGQTQSGWDMNLEEAEMVCCKNGHEFCEEHVVGDVKEFNKRMEAYDEWDGEGEEPEWDEEYRYYVDKEFCPICMMNMVTDADMLKYLKLVSKKSNADLIQDVKCRFKDYDAFNEFLNHKE